MGGSIEATRSYPHDHLPDRPIGRSATQNAALQGEIQGVQRLGATDIRVNQQQVNLAGQRVGINRPDLQYTLRGQRLYEEFDTELSDRAAAHAERILANDPLGVVNLTTKN